MAVTTCLGYEDHALPSRVPAVPRDHFAPKTAEAFSSSLHVRVRFPGTLATLLEPAPAPRPPLLHPLRLLLSHLVELNLCTPPPRAIPGRYPIPGFGSSPTSRPGSAHRARGARPDAPPPGPPARRVAASCAPPLPRRGGVAWTRASAAA